MVHTHQLGGTHAMNEAAREDHARLHSATSPLTLLAPLGLILYAAALALDVGALQLAAGLAGGYALSRAVSWRRGSAVAHEGPAPTGDPIATEPTTEVAYDDHLEYRDRVFRTLKFLEKDVFALIQQLSHAMETVEQASTDVATSTERSLHQAEEAESRSAKANNLFSQLDEGMRALSSSMHEISNRAERSGALIARTTEQARTNERNAGQLLELAREVSAAVSTIEAINKQTNLLALNAAIEAERAEHGSEGFTVVAYEVRALSRRINDSTRQIQSRMGDFHGEAERLGRSSVELKEISEALEETMREIKQSTGQQEAHIHTIAAHSETASEEARASLGLTRAVTGGLRVNQDKARLTLHTSAQLGSSSQHINAQLVQLLGELRETNPEERRSTLRVELSLEVEAACGDTPLSARLMDVSEGGARVACAHPLTPGDRLDVDLPHVGLVTGEIMWAHGSEAGIKFYDAQSRARARELIRAHTEASEDEASLEEAGDNIELW